MAVCIRVSDLLFRFVPNRGLTLLAHVATVILYTDHHALAVRIILYNF